MDRLSEQIIQADQRAALIAVTIANRHRNKNEPVHRLHEYVLHHRAATKPKPKQTRDEQIAVAASLTHFLGGTVALPPTMTNGAA